MLFSQQCKEGADWLTSPLNTQPVISGPAVINKFSPCPTFSLYSFHFVVFFLLIFLFVCFLFVVVDTLKMAGGRPGGTTGNTQVPQIPHAHTPNPKPSRSTLSTIHYKCRKGKVYLTVELHLTAMICA